MRLTGATRAARGGGGGGGRVERFDDVLVAMLGLGLGLG